VAEVALVLLDPEGMIRYWSDGAEAMFGHRAADVVGRRMDLFIPEELRNRHWIGWHRAWERGDIRDNLVAMIPVLCQDGEVRRFAGRLLPVKGPHGELVAAMGVWSPATEHDAALYQLA
jgi:PAS domain S-box-containing protein